jgi:hypothetical protein
MNILISEGQILNLVEAEMGRLYHGTSADFDKFDLSYFGTGSGGQSYGYGIYLSDVLKSANEYAEESFKGSASKFWSRFVSKMTFFFEDININLNIPAIFFPDMRLKLITHDYENIDSMINDFFDVVKKEIPKEYIEDFNVLKEEVFEELEYFPKKITYKIVLRKKGGDFKFLNWNEKIGLELAGFLQKEINKLKRKKMIERGFKVNPEMSGKRVYREVFDKSKFIGYKETSEWFNSIGFDGIKAEKIFGRSENYYVIFDPSLINIVEKK